MSARDRSAVWREEILIPAMIGECASRRRPAAGTQAGAGRRNGQVAGGEVRALHRRVAHRLEVPSAFAELVARHRGRAPEMRIALREPHIRKAVASVQRSKTAAVVAVEAGVPEASPVAAPPRVEKVTRANREPANRSPAEADAKSAAESEERHIGRRPQRTVIRVPVHRSRPPSPGSVVLEPAAIVIRSPAPGLIGDPRPSPVRFPDPVARAIRSPVSTLIRKPRRTIIGNVLPGAVVVEILRSHVVVVGVLSRCGIADHPVAIRIPLIPIIPGRRFAQAILRLVAVATDGNELVRTHARAALRSRNFNLATAHQYLGVIIRGYKNPKAGIA